MSSASANGSTLDGASTLKPMMVSSGTVPVPCGGGRRQHKDPVMLYQKYRDSWEKQKPPGTDSRLKLRWDIREQFHNQHDREDITNGVDKDKQSRGGRAVGCSVNTYVVPTDKSRMQLRWQIRMDLAKGIVPAQTLGPPENDSTAADQRDRSPNPKTSR